jgi:hypothetical protein
MTRRLNGRFAVCLLGGTIVVGLGALLLHGYQARRNASALLRQADRAEAKAGRAESSAEKKALRAEAVKFLGGYLAYAPGDTDALARYGGLLAELAGSRKERLRAYLVLERVI